MKRLNTSFAFLMLLVFSGISQSYLTPYPGYETSDVFPAYTNFQAIDIYDTLLYGTDGDTIHCLDLRSGGACVQIWQACRVCVLSEFSGCIP